jgi:sugar lactone lactonase YvrE
MEIQAAPYVDAVARLGEGPLWDFRESRLHWIDINGQSVHSFDRLSNQETVFNAGEFVSTVVLRSSQKGGGLVVALTRSIASINLSTGSVEKLVEMPEPLSNRLNDGKCDARGRLWIGSLSLEGRDGEAALYRVDGNLVVHKKLSGVSLSNGMSWSRDNKKMFYIDTGSNTIETFDFDLESGSIENRRLLVKNIWGGHFDGMTTDCDDNIFVAIWGGSRVLKLSSETGELLGTIHVPGVLNVTSCAFGGDGYSQLFITSSGEGCDRIAYPRAGSLYIAEDTGSIGLPSYEFAG